MFQVLNLVGTRKFIPPPWGKGGGDYMLQYFETILPS